MRFFRRDKGEELTIQVVGWEKIRVPSEQKCHHKPVLACEGMTDFAYCQVCGLRTPSFPHRGGWATDLFESARRKGNLFRDTSNLTKIYLLDEKGNIEPSLVYRYGESRKKKKRVG